MTDQDAMLESLTTSLRNAEATFGKGSAQSLDVLEVIEMYMVSLESGTLLEPTAKKPGKIEMAGKRGKFEKLESPEEITGLGFRNLVLRPKPKT